MTRPQITGGDWITWGPSDCSICSNVEPGPVIVANTETDPALSYAEYRANTRFLAASKQMAEALEAIFAIEDKLDGGDWDEIEEARGIAKQALIAAGYEF